MTAGIALVAGPILLLLGFIPSIIAGFAAVSAVVAAVGPVFVALTGPIGIIIAAIAALAAIAFVVIKNWTPIKKFFVDLWNNVKTVTETVLNNLKTFISTAWDSIKTNTETIWNAIKTFISNTWESIKAKTVEIWNNIKTAVSDKVEGVRSAIINGLEKAWSYIKGLPSQAFGWGENIIQGLINGLTSLVSTLWRKIDDIVNGIKRRIKEALKIGSPSKVTMEYGQAIGQGLLEGLKATKAGDLIASMMKGMIPKIPLTAAYAAEAGRTQGPAQGAAAVVNNFYAPLVQPGQLIIRSEQDIDKINQGLYDRIQSSTRARGVILSV